MNSLERTNVVIDNRKLSVVYRVKLALKMSSSVIDTGN